MASVPGLFKGSNGAQYKPKSKRTHSKDLLDVGNNLEDPLLINRTKPFRMPPSSVLSQVKCFLPVMQEANSKLEAQLKSARPEDVDIENIAECEQEIIEMNLSLFARDDDASSDDNDDGGMMMQDDGSDDDSDSDQAAPAGEVTTANVKLPNRSKALSKKRAMIEDLSEVKGHEEVKGLNLRSESRHDGGEQASLSPPNKEDEIHDGKPKDTLQEQTSESDTKR